MKKDLENSSNFAAYLKAKEAGKFSELSDNWYALFADGKLLVTAFGLSSLLKMEFIQKLAADILVIDLATERKIVQVRRVSSV